MVFQRDETIRKQNERLIEYGNRGGAKGFKGTPHDIFSFEELKSKLQQSELDKV